MPITHPFVSAVVDAGSPTEVGPDEWNASHTIDTSDMQVVGEIPSGTIDGVNLVFTLANTPKVNTEILYRNQIRLLRTTHYSISGVTITFVSTHQPQTGDTLIADYWRV